MVVEEGAAVVVLLVVEEMVVAVDTVKAGLVDVEMKIETGLVDVEEEEAATVEEEEAAAVVDQRASLLPLVISFWQPSLQTFDFISTESRLSIRRETSSIPLDAARSCLTLECGALVARICLPRNSSRSSVWYFSKAPFSTRVALSMDLSIVSSPSRLWMDKPAKAISYVSSMSSVSLNQMK
jgi:hypothetical protein